MILRRNVIGISFLAFAFTLCAQQTPPPPPRAVSDQEIIARAAKLLRKSATRESVDFLSELSTRLALYQQRFEEIQAAFGQFNQQTQRLQQEIQRLQQENERLSKEIAKKETLEKKEAK